VRRWVQGNLRINQATAINSIRGMASPTEQSLTQWSELGAKQRLAMPVSSPTPTRQEQLDSSTTTTRLTIDYGRLAELNAIKGLRGEVYDTSIVAHDKFVANVSTMLKQPEAPSQQRLERARQQSHKVEKSRQSAKAAAAAVGYGKKVTKWDKRRPIQAIVSSRPFERSSGDVEQLAGWLIERIPAFRELPRLVVQAVVETAWQERYEEPGLALAGDYITELTGVILKGTLSVNEEGGSSTGGPREVCTNEAFGAGYIACSSVLTAGSATLLVFNRSVMDNMLASIAAADCESKFTALSRVPELMKWAPSALRDVAPAFRWITLKPGEIFLSEGRRATNFGVIAVGQCAVFRDMEGGQIAGGKRRVQRILVGTLGVGAYFGEVSVLGGVPVGARRLSSHRSSSGPRGTLLPLARVEQYTVKVTEKARLLVIDADKAKGRALTHIIRSRHRISFFCCPLPLFPWVFIRPVFFHPPNLSLFPISSPAFAWHVLTWSI
jgi:CRP-like cAMP-binding protein